jgi:hypothetical protein
LLGTLQLYWFSIILQKIKEAVMGWMLNYF